MNNVCVFVTPLPSNSLLGNEKCRTPINLKTIDYSMHIISLTDAPHHDYHDTDIEFSRFLLLRSLLNGVL